MKNLFVCPAGKRTADAAELLAGDRFGPLLAEAPQSVRPRRHRHPAHQRRQRLSHHGTPRRGRLPGGARPLHPVKAVQRAVRLLAMGGATPVGFLLNRLPMGLGAKSAYYYYGAAYHDVARDKREFPPKISNQ